MSSHIQGSFPSFNERWQNLDAEISRKQKEDVANDKLAYAVLAPADLRSDDLEGTNPGITARCLVTGLNKLMEDKRIPLSSPMLTTIQKLKISLERGIFVDDKFAETKRLLCDDGKKQVIIQEVASTLSSDMQKLEGGEIDFPYLFMGGFLPRAGGKGHAIAYEVIKQTNGKLQLTINNTESSFDPDPKARKKSTIRALVYQDLTANDLNQAFWEPLAAYEAALLPISSLEPIYDHIQNRLSGKRALAGRVMKAQKAEVCALKSLTTWLHGQIAPGELAANRNPNEELVYLRLKQILIDERIVALKNNSSLKNVEIYRKHYNFASVVTLVYLMVTKILSFVGLMTYKPYSIKQKKVLPKEHNAAFLTTELEKKKARIDKKMHLLSHHLTHLERLV